MTDNTTVTTVSHEDASRLPEPKWFWRRILIYLVTVWAMAINTWMSWQVVALASQVVRGNDLATLGAMTINLKYGYFTVWGALVLYGVGASVTDVASLVSAVRTTRKETVTSAPPPVAVVTTAAGTTTTAAPEKPSWR